MTGQELGHGAEHVPKATERPKTTRLRAFATWTVVLAMSAASFAALGLILHLLYSDQSLFRTIMSEHVRAVVGIPLAATSAFCILLIFEARGGNIEFQALGFRFQGGSGPAVIWVFAFLALVSSIRLLW